MATLVTPDAATDPLADLVRSARADEARGLGGLYDRCATRMLRVAWRLTGSIEDAEDVVHDVFVALPGTLGHYQERGSIGAWLAQVKARATLMRMRGGKRRRETALSDAATVPGAMRSDTAAEYSDLEAEIARLPDALRAVFVLREIEGFTHDEIAELLGISVGASRVRMSRAVDALRVALAAPTPSNTRVASASRAARSAASSRLEGPVRELLTKFGSDRIGAAAWSAALQTQQHKFVDRMLSATRTRTIARRVNLISIDGSAQELRTMTKGQVTVVAFWSAISTSCW